MNVLKTSKIPFLTIGSAIKPLMSKQKDDNLVPSGVLVFLVLLFVSTGGFNVLKPNVV